MNTKRKRKGKRGKRGRKPGGRNKGYWYYQGRGWFTTDGGKRVPLRAENGDRLLEPDLPEEEVKKAYARWLLGKQEQARREATGESAAVLRVVQDYLDYAKGNNRPSTFEKRGEFLFDFCFGLDVTDRERDRPHRGLRTASQCGMITMRKE